MKNMNSGTDVKKVGAKGARTCEIGYPKDSSDWSGGAAEKGKDLPVNADGAAGGYGASTTRGN